MEKRSRIKIIITATLLGMASWISAQSYSFGLKGGGSLNMQKWTNSERDPMLGYCGDLYIESYNPEDGKMVLGIQAGYHQRGSALNINFSGGIDSYRMEFGNLSLAPYAKQNFNFSDKLRGYYTFGLRGEYNLNYDFAISNSEGFEDIIQKLTYGAVVGGGLYLAFGELSGGFLELSFIPDFSDQMVLPGGFQWENPYTGEIRESRAESIRNYSLELTLGINFIHLIEYID